MYIIRLDRSVWQDVIYLSQENRIMDLLNVPGSFAYTIAFFSLDWSSQVTANAKRRYLDGVSRKIQEREFNKYFLRWETVHTKIDKLRSIEWQLQKA